MLIWVLPLLVTFAKKRKMLLSHFVCTQRWDYICRFKSKCQTLLRIHPSFNWNICQIPSYCALPWCQVGVCGFFFNKTKCDRRQIRTPFPVTLYLTVSLNEMFMCLLSKENEDKWAFTSVYMCAPVGNIAGRLSSTNTESLLPSFSYLYCFLSLSSPHCTDRGKRQLSSTDLDNHVMSRRCRNKYIIAVIFCTKYNSSTVFLAYWIYS